MNFLKLAFLWLAITFVLPLAPNPVQKNPVPDNVRDAFLGTRVKGPTSKSGKPPKPKPSRATNSRLGLGYTVYQRNGNGDPVRVPETREFHQGDAVRLLIESNVDGYLYVFYTENDGPPKMIFPDWRLNGGRNRVRAHVPYETPSHREPNPNLRWFTFNKDPATERLYLVVTKSPLASVPTGNALLAYCQANVNACPWRPAETTWTQLAANASSAREGKSAEFGQVLTAVEREAVERGFGLGLDAPAPSVIKISTSPQAKQLVTMIALIHK